MQLLLAFPHELRDKGKAVDFRRTTGRNARWSLAQTIISTATVFVLYKYLYNTLGPEVLGLWAVVLASVSLGRLAELGFSTTILRYVSRHLANGNKEHAARILETGLISIGCPFALVLLVLYPIANESMRYVVPIGNLVAAREILPYALGTLWFGVTGSIIQSALDGCGRMDIKSRILIIGNLVYVPAAILLVQNWNITGLAACQLLQSAIVGILVWRATRQELPALKWAPLNWDKACFREILGYAAGLQLGNLLLMLFEPATKILLSRYCGLNEVAHFEMANQVVSRVRALITSATQAYLPTLSSSAENVSFVRQIVREAMIFTAGIGLPVMAVLVISFPVISILWIGQIQTDFIVYGWILGLGWLISTLAIPMYYYCVGAGRIQTILFSQILMVSLNILLGLPAAISGSGYLVAMSMMISLALSTLIIGRQLVIDLKISLRQLTKSPPMRNVIKTILFIGIVLITNVSLSIATSLGKFVFLNFLIHALILLMIAYWSDARGILASRFRRAG
ncbi:lipopolysaccharide biosynthesis protein [Ferribacterium limneticum]|uniref:lipopolysaccharide biosynthesis protein n=1 Tax=Ferribacterium limneticum TaxID=76259 RepID=UPI001CF95131|nr:lipopolysaccharide biosynthesis protein [Ferribacterium limneticum]UCV29982.1 lipopolysaccharide biosynthesis protein [Ferribacterium limneticum]UCV33901.1 lipopolysaccharide biosynthesis protein [Ferribacterium limneticum]